jgi:hypothetical protein
MELITCGNRFILYENFEVMHVKRGRERGRGRREREH